jgi:hypothetical protein
MTDPALPSEVWALLRGPVATMAHVEALLLLRQIAPAAGPLSAIATKAQIGELMTMRRYLGELSSAGLVAVAPGDTYHYAPADAARRQAVDLLAQMYNEKPVTLVRAIRRGEE